MSETAVIDKKITNKYGEIMKYSDKNMLQKSLPV